MVSDKCGGKEVTIESQSAAAWLERTVTWIERDTVFCCRAATNENYKEAERSRFARISILLMALYLESLSNLLFDSLAHDPLDALDCRTDLPCPLRKFRAVYVSLCHTDLPLDVQGLRDIFTIRNRVIAHPAGFSPEIDAPTARKRVDRTVTYFKFASVPATYSQFSHEHANLLLSEVRDFVVQFHNLTRQELEDRFKRKPLGQVLLEACWPRYILEYLDT